MNKKIILILVSLLLINNVLAADIALIVKTSENANIALAINELGYTYDVIPDSSIPTTDFSNYPVLLIQDSITNINQLPLNEKDVLFLDRTLAETIWPECSIGTTNAFSARLEQLGTHFTEGFTGVDFNAYTTAKNVYYLNVKPSYVYKVAKSTGTSSFDKAIVAYSNTNAYKRVFFGFFDINYWSSDTKKLFKNSLKWVIKQSCTDSDGDYYIKEDFSIGICKNICGPNFNEACKGNNDCNDNDSEFNPGSPDPYKNCINDAPIMESISKITIRETESAAVTINAIDPENDSISYSINDSRFVQDLGNKNRFTWHANYGDKGNYTFQAIASDGKLQRTLNFQVQVLKTNRAPSCTNIPTIRFNEDEKFNLNLKNYCSDSDGDVLTYIKVSYNTYVSLDSLENGTAIISSAKDWSGEEWIKFKVSDGIDETETNEISVIVSPVNDPPVLVKNIEKITWYEHTNAINRINLSEYFSDIENDALSFTVSENNNINITINNGLASFYPKDKHFVGTENIVFSASDGKLTTNSNQVTLEVLDSNEPPEFGEINCSTSILEDTEYSCELTASDIENDTISFSVVNNTNMNCTLEGNILNYISYKDYFGNASCTLRVTDAKNSYTDLIFNVQVQNINDPPVISSFFPDLSSLKLINGAAKLFSISGFDIDSQIIHIVWFINDEQASSETNNTDFIFNKTNGDYVLRAELSDGEYAANKTWNVFVRDIMFFTCSEVEGYICTENQTCSQNFLGVYDTDKCCPVACIKTPPQFSAIRKLDRTKTDFIYINIQNATNLFVNETKRLNIELQNKANETIKDIDLEIYLYDTTDERIIQREKNSTSLNQDAAKYVYFDLQTQYDLDENHEYALFVRAIGTTDSNSEFYSENYTELSFKRKDHEVMIESINIEPKTELICGDSADVSVKIMNIGKNEEFVSLRLESSDLNIDETANSLKLEKYLQDDELKESFSISIPNGKDAGNYTLRATASYQNKTVSFEKEIILGDCKDESTELKPLETIKINQAKPSQATTSTAGDDNRKIMFLLLNVFSFILILFLLVISGMRSNRSAIVSINNKKKSRKLSKHKF